jgi:hypothetical protein
VTWSSTSTSTSAKTPRSTRRWTLFTTDVQTRQAILYGRPPQVSVSRRFSDASDEVGRVAAEMLERLLNMDLEIATDGAAAAYEAALEDRLLPGMASVRLRYSARVRAGAGC